MTQTVEGPDGRTHEFPDQATPEQIQGALRQEYKISAAPTAPSAPTPSFADKIVSGIEDFKKNDPRAQTLYGAQEGAAAAPGVPLDMIIGGGNFLRRQMGVPEMVPSERLNRWRGPAWVDFARRNGIISTPPAGEPTGLAEGGRRLGRFLGSSAVMGGPEAIPSAITGAIGSEVGKAVDPTGYGEAIGGVVGSLAPTATAATIPAIASGVKRAFRGGNAGRLALESAIKDADTAGTNITVGQGTQKPFSQYTEALLRYLPGGAGRIAKVAESAASDIGAKIQDMAGRLAKGADPVSAGQAVQRGIGGFMKNFRNTSERLYGDVDAAIPPDTAVSVSRTVGELGKVLKPIGGAPGVSKVMLNNKLADVSKALLEDVKNNNGDLPYEGVKQLRSWLGRQLSDNSLVNDLPRAQLKQIYGALSDDMRNAAVSQGPDAERAFNRASDYYSASMKRIDEHLDRLSKLGAEPEKLFESLWRGREGDTFLQQVRRSINPDDWKFVASAVLKRLGDANPSAQNAAGTVFSPETFLTQWNKISPASKQSLFGGYGTLRGDLDAVARTVGRIRGQSKILSNSSGTTPTALNAGAAGAGILALGTGQVHIAAGIAGQVLFNNLTARMMTSPKFVRWLAKTVNAKPSLLPTALSALPSVASSTDQDTAKDIQAYAQQFTGRKAQP